jgi:hypothetical protein
MTVGRSPFGLLRKQLEEEASGLWDANPGGELGLSHWKFMSLSS